MNWNDSIDGYCERLHPGWWAEPLNAVTNLAFVLAALALWRSTRKHPHAATDSQKGAVRLLALLLTFIGLASLLFHTLATRWAGALDSGAIALFMLCFLPVWLRHGQAVHWRHAWLGAPLLVLWVVGFNAAARAAGINAFGLYGPAWLALVLLAASAWTRQPRAARWFAAAATAFACSLTLRQLDLPLCDVWPNGTHFGWHLLNALTLYASARAVLVARAPSPATSS